MLSAMFVIDKLFNCSWSIWLTFFYPHNIPHTVPLFNGHPKPLLNLFLGSSTTSTLKAFRRGWYQDRKHNSQYYYSLIICKLPLFMNCSCRKIKRMEIIFFLKNNFAHTVLSSIFICYNLGRAISRLDFFSGAFKFRWTLQITLQTLRGSNSQ